MYTRKQALAIAIQIRTCPPPDVSSQECYQTENKRHTEICPFCSTGIQDEINAWNALSENFKQSIAPPPPAADKKDIRKGQIRVVNKNLCSWQEGYYYNEPIVLVLTDTSQIEDELLVAQTWNDSYLASPGDLVVPEHLRTGPGELFIEPWNIYTLKKEYLGKCLETVADDVVEQALKMHEDPAILPSWAPRLMPLAPDDPRTFFQALEIKTGYFFSIQAVTELMGKQSAENALFAGDAVDSLMAKIKQMGKGVSWIWQPASIDECLALLRFEPEAIPLSASPEDQKKIMGVYICLGDGKIKSITPVECPIFHETLPPEQYKITGTIPGLPSGVSRRSFMCYLSNEKNQQIIQGEWCGQDTGENFLVRFDRIKKNMDRISIVIVDDISGTAHP